MNAKISSFFISRKGSSQSPVFHKKIKVDTLVIALTIFIGLFLRVYHYLCNRALWLDESRLALNIIDRSWSQLLLPLDHVQGAPILFLFIERLAVQTLGNTEYALRLFPLVCGMVSLVIFSQVSIRFVSKSSAILSIVLFSTSIYLIYYSSEVKQYSSDVLIAVLLYFSYFKFFRKDEFSIFEILIFNTFCCISVWLSHPSVFVMAGIFLCVSIRLIRQEKWKDLAYFLAPSLVVLLSFIIFYFGFLHGLINHRVFRYWDTAFLPLFSTFSLSGFIQIAKNLFLIFDMPLGFSFTGIAFLAFAVGTVSLFQKDKEKFFVLISPLIFTMMASSLRLYPFIGRLLMFLVPSLLIFIAEGSSRIFKTSWKEFRVIAIVFLSLLLMPLILYAAQNVIKPPMRDEIRPVLEYIKRQKSQEDSLYVYYNAHAAFEYYKNKYDLSGSAYVVGIMARENWEHYVRDLDRLCGHEKVWIVFSHVYRDEKRFFLNHLDLIGKQKDAFESQGASAYLYDMTATAQLRNSLHRCLDQDLSR